MSVNPSSSDPSRWRPRIVGLRANALAAIVMLILEYALGIWMNLDGRVPDANHGTNLWGAFIGAITRGPVALTLHALLGTLLVVTAIGLAVRSIRARRSLWVALAGTGLLAVVIAWLAGDRFVSTGDNEPSLFMALTTAVALLCYVLVMFSLTFSESWSGTGVNHRGAGA